MAETEMLNEKQKRDFCAFLLKAYGIQIDMNNELLPIYFLAYNSARVSQDTIKRTTEKLELTVGQFDQNLKDNLEKIQTALGKIQTTQYQFKSRKEAFWLGFGQFGFSILASVTIISLTLFAGWWLYQEKQHKASSSNTVKSFIESSEIDSAKTNNLNVSYITLHPSKDLESVVVGRNYIYDQKCNCIRIPVKVKGTKK
ncbi:hypothetical protein QNI19_31945 [Cytophagaceae bacterium DM2B3-1]|uniref:Uncharacterized protein n=1 Tax=Xanthocytophaga flava TaxID=3048013 RepID=A0ABT7CUZ6_9BACT|nr:hypothetical protein [Xanthocytophaga flavus]MDJ1497595.1 hypothetical protein [Xanthocytophaga flavus]